MSMESVYNYIMCNNVVGRNNVYMYRPTKFRSCCVTGLTNFSKSFYH